MTGYAIATGDTPRPGWWQRAVDAAETQIRQQERQDAEREANMKKARAHSFTVDLASKFGVQVLEVDVQFRTSGNDYLAPYVELHGVTLKHGEYGFVATVQCPDCDRPMGSGAMRNVEDLGFFLRDPSACHTHWFADDSTHPNRPEPKAPAPVQHTPTPSEKLADALHDFVLETIRCEGLL